MKGAFPAPFHPRLAPSCAGVILRSGLEDGRKLPFEHLFRTAGASCARVEADQDLERGKNRLIFAFIVEMLAKFDVFTSYAV